MPCWMAVSSSCWDLLFPWNTNRSGWIPAVKAVCNSPKDTTSILKPCWCIRWAMPKFKHDLPAKMISCSTEPNAEVNAEIWASIVALSITYKGLPYCPTKSVSEQPPRCKVPFTYSADSGKISLCTGTHIRHIWKSIGFFNGDLYIGYGVLLGYMRLNAMQQMLQ